MRARNLKPGLYKNPELADAGPIAQLLFAGLWLLADKEGRLKDQPRVIKAELFPYYEVDVNRELTVIERLGHIHRYVTCGIAVIEVCNFKKHQSPHHTEKASDLPACECVKPCSERTQEINGDVTVNSPLDDGGNPSDSLIPDSLIPSKSPLPKRERSKAAKVEFPSDFALSDGMRQQALDRYSDCDVDEMFVQFRAHHVSTGKTMKVWTAAWTTWIGNAAKFGYPKRGAGGKQWE